MAQSTPATMRALAISSYCKPSAYDISTSYPTPKLSKSNDILIRAHAASINPIDVKMASGLAKAMQTNAFPYQIGYDVAGTVVAVGSGVTLFKAGDEVYSRVPTECRGSVAEYVLSNEDVVAQKPEKLSFVEAASIPLAALTALQSLYKADELLEGGIKGKTVLVPGGLSGTGSFAVQLAKNVFGASQVITTLSTQKIEKAKDLLGADTFKAVDYTEVDVAKAVGNGTVDYLFDTMATTFSLLKTVKKGGVICSVSTLPSGTAMKEIGGMDDMPIYFKWLLDLVDWFFRFWTGRAGVQYTYISMHPDRTDLDKLSEYVKNGLIKPIVGRTAKLSDIQGVRDGCQEVFEGKGGIGKFVIEID